MIEKMANPILFFVLAGLFLVFAILQLVFAFIENKKLRAITKPFCSLLLGLLFLAVDPALYLLTIAFSCSCIGDIFFLFKEHHKLIVLGTFFFFLGHLLFIGKYLMISSSFSLPYILVLLSILAILFVLLYLNVRKIETNRANRIGAPLYFATLLVHWGSSLYATIRVGILFFCLIGASFFLFSDILIVYHKKVKPLKKRDFFVMSTYLVALVFLTIGFLAVTLA